MMRILFILVVAIGLGLWLATYARARAQQRRREEDAVMPIIAPLMSYIDRQLSFMQALSTEQLALSSARVTNTISDLERDEQNARAVLEQMFASPTYLPSIRAIALAALLVDSRRLRLSDYAATSFIQHF